jgi:hypothetical protein
VSAIAAVEEAKQALDAATLAARRSGETFKDTGAGAELSRAWDVWMRARAAAGDPFARSLGFMPDGSWSLDAWTAGRS